MRDIKIQGFKGCINGRRYSSYLTLLQLVIVLEIPAFLYVRLGTPQKPLMAQTYPFNRSPQTQLEPGETKTSVPVRTRQPDTSKHLDKHVKSMSCCHCQAEEVTRRAQKTFRQLLEPCSTCIGYARVFSGKGEVHCHFWSWLLVSLFPSSTARRG